MNDINSIIDAAVRVFLERGYDGTSMAQIAQAAGIKKPSLYHHVRSKEDLLRLGVSRALDAYAAMLNETQARQPDPVPRLRYVVTRTCDLVALHAPEVALLVRARGNTATERWALNRRRQLNGTLAGIIKDALSANPEQPGLDPLIAARLIFGMIDSAVNWLKPGPRSAEQLRTAVEALLFAALF